MMKSALSILLMFVAVSLAVSLATVPTGLVAWYPCNERPNGSYGMVIDSSGYGNTLFTMGNGSHRVQWSNIAAKEGSYLNFNSTSVPVKSHAVSPFNFKRALTISAWVKLSTVPNVNMSEGVGYPIVSKRNSYYFGFTKEGLVASFKDPINVYNEIKVNDMIYDTVTWYHVILIVDLDKQIRDIYINGMKKDVAVGMFDTIIISADSLVLGSSIYEGKAPGELDGGFPGYIDGVRLYNRALDSNEVLQLYHEYDVATVMSSVSLKASQKNASVMVHGNQVTVRAAAGVQVSVYDPAGKKINLEEGKINLKSGLYLYKVVAGKELYTNRFYIK